MHGVTIQNTHLSVLIWQRECVSTLFTGLKLFGSLSMLVF